MKLEAEVVETQVKECGSHQMLEESPAELLERGWSCSHIGFGSVKLIWASGNQNLSLIHI